MKKKLIIILITFLSYSIYSQQVQDCNVALRNDLKRIVNDNEYSSFRDWLYEYYQKDEKEQSFMKKKNSSNFSSSISAIIKSIPISGSVQNTRGSDKNLQAFKSVEEFYLKNRYLTDEKINELFVSELSENQLIAYTTCLNAIKNAIGLGFSYTIGGNPLDEFYIQVKYNSMASGDKITLKGNASYLNLIPIGSITFKDKSTITDKQTRTQYFKRINATKEAVFSFDIVNSQNGIEPIVLPAQPIDISSSGSPIGTIIASILSYDSFLTANNIDKRASSDMQKAIWVPCDGRDVTSSTYGKYSGGKVPDLRGVFLRGVNDFSVLFPSTKTVSVSQKNPEEKLAGEFQSDSVGKHSHGWTGLSGSGNPKESEDRVSGDPSGRTNAYPVEPVKNYTENPGLETRPKNISVYYYIKIN
ncbi:hypothetical protein [Chryseobacterium flavum]|uniref:hypothetical protein n=1 Tax=Chryseobacterium flavum TaxID=415851 RepID=UPI0028ABC291|nr:hypothetical protein [Chryseobacterium flavum]